MVTKNGDDDLPPEKILHEILGEHATNPRVLEWVREFRIFMRERETWYPEKDAPFWNRLGIHGDLTAHMPIGLNATGEGPITRDNDVHHYQCWCGDVECPLTVALQHAWLAGKRAQGVTYWFTGEAAPRDV